MPRVKLDYVVGFSNEDSENPASNLLALEVSKKKWLCAEGEPSCSVVLQLVRAVQISTVHVGAVHAALIEVLVGRSEKPNDQFEVLVPSSVFLSPLDSRRGAGVERVRSFSGDQLTAAQKERWDRVRVVCSQPYNKHCKYGLNFIHIFESEDTKVPEPAPKAEAPALAVPGRMMVPDTFSSDEEDFRPGEMFAKHLQRTSDGAGSSNTGAQIRQATSQALKNISDSSTKLVKTPITKTSHRPNQTNPTTNSNRQKETLMYTDDDEQPHTKIDSIVQRHKDQKDQEKKKKETPKKDKQEPSTSRSFRDFIDDKEEKRHLNNSRSKDKDSSKDDKNETKKDLNSSRSKEGSRDEKRKKDEERPSSYKKRDDSSQNRDKDNRKRPHPDEQHKRKESLRAGPVSSSPHTLLASVVFALSGYENPRRARLRDAAAAMGARFERDWSPRCTHLICAFPNTPKLKTVRASRASCIAVRGEWVEQCCSQRRLLPWQWFATEDKHKVTPPPQQDERDNSRDPSDCDTDDEIEKVLRKQKKQRTDKSPSPRPHTSRDRSPQPHSSRQKSPSAYTNRERTPKPSTSRDISPIPSTSRDISPIPSTSRDISPIPSTGRDISPIPSTSKEKSPRPQTTRKSPKSAKDMSNISSDSDVAFVKDERVQGNITIDSDSDETDEEKPVAKETVDQGSVLAEFFDGLTFVIDERVEEDGVERDTLARYVRAYGGVVMDASQMDSDSEVNYVLSTDASRPPASGQLVRADWVWRCHEDQLLCDVNDYLL